MHSATSTEPARNVPFQMGGVTPAWQYNEGLIDKARHAADLARWGLADAERTEFQARNALALAVANLESARRCDKVAADRLSALRSQSKIET